MAITSIALLTIGQSPRPDMTAGIEAAIPASVNVLQVGLLDDLTRAQAESEFAPKPGEMPLVTLLRDGRPISISSGGACQALQGLIDRLAGDGVGAIVLLCTGPLSELRSGSAWLVHPDAIVPAMAAALLPDSRLGVILPDHDQIDFGPSKWDHVRARTLYASASPYDEDTTALRQAARELVDAGAEAIVLDCMGYGARHGDAVGEAVSRPVIVSSSVVAGTLSSLF
jgi:protein AroM